MSRDNPAVSGHSAQVAGRFALAFVAVGNALRTSWDKGPTAPFNLVLWSMLGITALYGGALLAGALADRPVRPRNSLRLEGLSLLAMLPVTSWSIVAAAAANDWGAATMCALVGAAACVLLWLVARQLRALPPSDDVDRGGAGSPSAL